jgi:hypothetical protein
MCLTRVLYVATPLSVCLIPRRIVLAKAPYNVHGCTADLTFIHAVMCCEPGSLEKQVSRDQAFPVQAKQRGRENLSMAQYYGKTSYWDERYTK